MIGLLETGRWELEAGKGKADRVQLWQLQRLRLEEGALLPEVRAAAVHEKADLLERFRASLKPCQYSGITVPLPNVKLTPNNHIPMELALWTA